MAIINPHTTEDQMQQGGDYRPMLGKVPRDNGLKVHMIGSASTKDRLSGVIIPSFDFRLDTCDGAFQKSVGAFWKDSPDPKHPKHLLPNGWAVPLICYTFMGENNEHFISPANRAQMLGAENCTSDEKADAFNDLWCSIKFDKSLSNADKDYFLKKPSTREDARIPNRQTRFFSFASVTNKTNNTPEDVVLCYTGAAHTHMVEQARWRNEPNDTVLDPSWPRYMLGDPTRKESAMVWTVDKRMLDAKDAQETNCIIWTDKRETLNSPVSVRQIDDTSLAKRFVLIDPSCWNIPTYQEMVDYMLANYNEEVTSEMIRNACGHRADVAERRQRPRAAARAEKVDEDDYNPMDRVQTTTYAPAPPAAQAPAPTQTPAPPAPPSVVMFWVSVAGNVSEVASSAMPGLVASHGDIMTMAHDKSGGWVTASSFGFKNAAASPVVTSPSAAPAPPAPPAPPTAPSEPVASLDDTRRNIYDDATYALLDDAKKAEVDAVVVEMSSYTAAGKPMPASVVDKVMQLMGA
jgi:hypothetical protein